MRILFTKSIKILQISTADIGGGAEKSAKYLFDAYRARGYKSWLAVGYKKSNDPDIVEIPRVNKSVPLARFYLKVYHRLEPIENRVRGVCFFRYWLKILAGGWQKIEQEIGLENFDFPGSRELLKLLPQRPNIIHAHNLHGNYFDLRFLPQLSHQVPVIVNLRDAWLLSGHCSHSLNCERWKIGCGKCPDLTLYPEIKHDASAFNWQRKKNIYSKSRLYITTPSQWLMDKVQLSMLQGDDYRVIANGIELKYFHPGDQFLARTKLGLPHSSKIVLFSANRIHANKWKDYATMEAAISQIASNTEIDLIFLCIGEEGKEKKIGKTRILFKSFEYDEERIALYYQASDVYIHAAFAETFPRTIIEALACGVPVVATAVGGIPEQIKDGVTGFLVPPKDAQAMAYRIKQLLLDDDLHRNFSTAAAEDAFVRFGLERQVDSFLNWYQEIIMKSQDINGYA